MTTYRELKREITESASNYEGIFWAFNDKQFKKGLGKLGLNGADVASGKLAKLGAGGFILADKKESYWKHIDGLHAKMKKALKNEAFLLEALIYELINHEFIITYDATDALESLSLKADDVPSELLKEAKREAVRRCE